MVHSVITSFLVAGMLTTSSAFAPTSADILISNPGGFQVQQLGTATVGNLVNLQKNALSLGFDPSNFNLLINNRNEEVSNRDKTAEMLTTLFFRNNQREEAALDPTTNQLYGMLLRTVMPPGSSIVRGMTARDRIAVVTEYGLELCTLGRPTDLASR
jgi:hypothetical protein